MLFLLPSKQITHVVLIGIGMIVFGSLNLILFGILPLSIALEIGTILIALLVSTACLLHIYQEHKKNDDTEYQLKKWILLQIYSMDPRLAQTKAIRHYLENTLAGYGLPQRLKKLFRYQKDPHALYLFIQRFKKQEDSQKTLKDLGLSW